MLNVKTLFLCIGCMAGVAAAGQDDTSRLGMVEAGRRLEPIAIQKAVFGPGGQIISLGEKIPYNPGGSGRTNYRIAYDCFEPDAQGDPTEGADCGGYDPVCSDACSGSRLFFGEEYISRSFADGIEPSVAFLDWAERVQYGWFQLLDEDSLFIAIVTAQRFSEDCAGFDTNGDGVPDSALDEYFDGVLYSFGEVSGAGGYYWMDVDLAGLGLSHQLPLGRGGVSVTHLGDSDGDGIPDRLANSGQPMLWSTEKELNFSYSSATFWDLDNDGIFDPSTDCGDYDFGVCPGPLSAMIAFYGVPDVCPDCNRDGVIDTRDFLCYLALFSAGDPAADCDGNGIINTLDFLCFLGLFNNGC